MNKLTRRQTKGMVGILTLALLPVLGCSGSTVANIGQLALGVQGTQPGDLATSSFSKMSNEALAVNEIAVYNALGTQVGTLTLTDARVAVKEIEFDREDDDQAVEDIDLRGPYIVDLLSNVVTPSIENISLPSGIYEAIELDLDKIDGSEFDETGSSLIASTDPLFGNSIYVAGTYTGLVAGGTTSQTVPFSMSFDLDEEFELTAPGATTEGFVVTKDTVNNIIIAFRLVRWFAFDDPDTNANGLDFSNLSLVGGAIVLDENSTANNSDIRKVIKENIKESADYGNDDDGDGVLGSDEDDDQDDSMDN